MKLLLAYDGSRCAEAAIDDLYHAGLPSTGSIHMLEVAEVWLPPPDAADDPDETAPTYINDLVRMYRERADKVVAEATAHVKRAEARVRTALPDWTVTSSATYGSPAWEILAAADTGKPDLIVVGSHGQSALTRFFLGSISQKVLTEARCSVRVARGRNEIDAGPERIVIGFDGSGEATAAVNSVASRNWHAGTKVKLITATGAITPHAVTNFVPPVVSVAEDVNVTERRWVEQLAEAALAQLRGAGVDASLHIYAGSPKEILVKEAERWSADCIFVGAHAHTGALERVLLGSTSGAVAARAHCSVEVVRAPETGASRSNGNTA